MRNFKALLNHCEEFRYTLELIFDADENTYRLKVCGYKEFYFPYYAERFFDFWMCDEKLEVVCKKMLNKVINFDDRPPMRME